MSLSQIQVPKKNHFPSYLPAGDPDPDSPLPISQLDGMSPEDKSSQLEGQSPEEKSSELEGHSQLLLESSRSNQLDLISPEEKSQLEGQSPEEKSSQLEGHSQLLLDSAWSNQLDGKSQLDLMSPEEKSSQLEGHSQLEDSSDLANFLALGLAKIAVTRREIIKIFLIIFSEGRIRK